MAKKKKVEFPWGRIWDRPNGGNEILYALEAVFDQLQRLIDVLEAPSQDR